MNYNFKTSHTYNDGVVHPYMPRNIKLAGYYGQTRDWVEILSIFSILCLVIGSITYFVGSRCKHLSKGGRWLLVWFVVSGLIHFVVEGTFAVWTDYYKDTKGYFLADMWKEYSKAIDVWSVGCTAVEVCWNL